MSVVKWQTRCCALCYLTVSDDDTKEEIESVINKLKKEAKKKWTPDNRESGERACYVIVAPGETNLIKNLNVLGFELVSTSIPRRNGYPEGKLKMYMLTW